MSILTLNQQDRFNINPPAGPLFSEYYCTLTGDPAFHGVTGPFQVAPGVSYAPCIPNENALGLYETCTSESDWTVEALGYPFATGTPKQTDTQNFSTAFLPALDSGVQHLRQPPIQLASKETVLSDIGDNFVRQPSRTVALLGSLRAQKPPARLQRDGGSLQSAGILSHGLLRHTPYSVGSDQTRWSDSPLLGYQCEWFDGTGQCGIQISASKHAIGQHLHTMHAVQLKADKTSQVCHWGRCWKSMRKESIVRHILEVHMQDKVLCPICGSTFARMDSMQRHQRTHCHDSRDASDTPKARN